MAENYVRHPALREQDEKVMMGRANRELQMENEQLRGQGAQVANENAVMKQAMQDPNVDTNIGGLNRRQGLGMGPTDGRGPMGDGQNNEGDLIDNSGQSAMVNPVDALYDGISQGATLEDMQEVGMIDEALAAMAQEGYSEEDQGRLFQELQALSEQPNTSQGNPYALQ